VSTVTAIDHNDPKCLMENLERLNASFDHTILSTSSPPRRIILHVIPTDYRLSWYEVQSHGKPLVNASGHTLQFSYLDKAIQEYSRIR